MLLLLFDCAWRPPNSHQLLAELSNQKDDLMRAPGPRVLFIMSDIICCGHCSHCHSEKYKTWIAFHTTEHLQGLYNDLDVSLKTLTVLISSLHHVLQRGIWGLIQVSIIIMPCVEEISLTSSRRPNIAPKPLCLTWVKCHFHILGCYFFIFKILSV